MTTLTTAAVIATFNQERYIAEAVASLADQVDEVVVIDDCSSDQTTSVLAGLAFSNLRILRNERQMGVSRSFNAAIAASSADVLLIQGGDDRSLPGRAAVQAQALEDPDVVMVHSVPRVIDALGQRLPPELAAEFSAKPADDDPLAFLFFSANYICAPAAALRRADYERLGGFPGGLDLLQDYALWLRLAAEGTIVDLGTPVVEYRKHGLNLSREYVGLDSPKRRRLAAEMSYIRRAFVSGALPVTLAKLAEHCGIEAEWFGRLAHADQVALIQLSHQDKLVSRHGLDHLFALAGERDGEHRLAGLRLTIDDLSRFAIRADHENLEDVGRAMAVTRSLAPRADRL
jgi:glycosyltransferase involved in cell wall biosynthesis